MEVEYRDVPGFPGYRVGNDGSVWSRRTRRGNLSNDWRRLEETRQPDGYVRITFCVDSVRTMVPLNRLVLEVFKGPKPDGMETAHENNIRHDNRLDNLAWKTHEVNVADKKRHGTHQAGEKHPLAKLTETKVLEIRLRAASGEMRSALAMEYGVQVVTIYAILKRRLWKHI